MQLVIDTNILVSFFRPNPVQLIITNSASFGIKLFAPEYAIDELKKNQSDILKYAKINSNQFEEKLSELSHFINIVSGDSFSKFKEEAKQLVHEKDLPIFALALKLNCAIWSNEPSFKKQDKIPVFSTREMIELLF